MSEVGAAGSVRHTSGTLPALALLRQGIRDILSRQRLIRYLVQADMKKRGSDTVLGNLWWILDPLLQMTVYLIFVTIISRRSTPDYPLFIFSAILPWKWYQSVISDATTSVVASERLIKQIAFPKIVLPISTATAGIVGFAWGLLPLFGLLLLQAQSAAPLHRLSVMVLWLPVIVAVQFVFTLASAIFVSAANVFFRDLGNAIGHGLRLWWFLSPGLYSLASLQDINFIKTHPIIGFLASMNPFAVLFEAYRSVIYGGADGVTPPRAPDVVSLGYLLLGSIIFMGLCIVFFKRVEPEFAKVL